MAALHSVGVRAPSQAGAAPNAVPPKFEASFLQRGNGVGKPGKPPAIHKAQDSIVIVMDVAPPTSRAPVRLVLRCERNGEIFASIDRSSSPP